MTPEQLAEIEQNAAYFAVRTDADLHQLVGKDVPALLAEVERLREENAAVTRQRDQLKTERDTALTWARRLMAERDAVARAVRSPNLTDAEKFAEIREAFAIAEGQSEEAGR